MIIPVVNCWYRNAHNNERYRVVTVSNKEATRPGYPVTVSYVDESGKVWSNTLEEFNAKMTNDDSYLRN